MRDQRFYYLTKREIYNWFRAT